MCVNIFCMKYQLKWGEVCVCVCVCVCESSRKKNADKTKVGVMMEL